MEFGIFAAGLIGGGLISWLLASVYSRLSSKEQSKKFENLETKIDEIIYAVRDRYSIESDIRDPSMQDGGKVTAEVLWQGGPIIDIGNPHDTGRNRITVFATRPNRISMEVRDSEGRGFHLESPFDTFDRMTSVECLWSSADGIISIFSDKRLLAALKMSNFAIFQAPEETEIRIAGTFEGEGGFGNIRNVQVFSEKRLGPH